MEAAGKEEGSHGVALACAFLTIDDTLTIGSFEMEGSLAPVCTSEVVGKLREVVVDTFKAGGSGDRVEGISHVKGNDGDFFLLFNSQAHIFTDGVDDDISAKRSEDAKLFRLQDALIAVRIGKEEALGDQFREGFGEN